MNLKSSFNGTTWESFFLKIDILVKNNISSVSIRIPKNWHHATINIPVALLVCLVYFKTRLTPKENFVKYLTAF